MSLAICRIPVQAFQASLSIFTISQKTIQKDAKFLKKNLDNRFMFDYTCVSFMGNFEMSRVLKW